MVFGKRAMQLKKGLVLKKKDCAKEERKRSKLSHDPAEHTYVLASF